MTTIKTYLANHLTNAGLFPNQAGAVQTLVEAKHQEMAGRWDDSIQGYPKGMLATLQDSANQEAVKYLKQTKPNHWGIAFLESL